MSAQVLALVLASAALLAGCLNAPVNTASTKDAPAASVEMPSVGTSGVFHVTHESWLTGVPNASFPAALGGEFMLPAGATEPSIGAAKDGGVYMTGFGPTIGAGPVQRTPPTLWATFDSGATIKDVGPYVGPVPEHPSTNDPIVFVDYDTGRVFMDDILPLSCGALSFSDDHGATWTTNPYSCGNTNVNDHQTVGAAKPRMLPTVGYPNVVYRCTNNGVESGCAMSYDGGLSFTPQVPVFNSVQDGCGGLTSHLRAGPDGTMYLPKADCPGGPKIKYTQDDGLSWQTLQIPLKQKVGDHEMGFAVDKDGNMYATFESGGQVWYTASPDKGKTWLEPRNVTAPGVTATMFNQLAVGDPGHVAFAYVGSTVPGGYEGKCKGNAGLTGDLLGQPSCPEWDNATWNAYLGVMVDGLKPNATVESVTANDPMDPLARGLCGGTRCHGMNDFIEVAIDNVGRPWASFVDVCTDKCVKDPSMHSDVVKGMFATLRAGPALRGANLTLPMLEPQGMGDMHHELG
ncbi:MAG: hypothetical protein QOE90_32 [Thermoplasmata archaeon]|jgi:hypothetical protein|nr:hypothetical protein [Thermoplasmata archaeon]